MQKGEGYTKRTLTRWSPDWNLAAAAFENAQKKFTAAGKKYSEFQISAALRAADAYEELNSLNSAAKMVEKATFVMDGAGITSSKSREDAVKLARRAGDLYRANGQSDKASALYAKGAEILGDEDVKASLELFQEALDCYLAENKEVLSHDCFKKAIAFAIKVEEFEYAIRWLQQDAEIYHKQGSTSGHRNILGIIILHLYRKDLENASNVLASADP